MQARKEIRQYITDQLKGNTAAGYRVYNSKVTPNMQNAVFPLIQVFIAEDKAGRDLNIGQLWEQEIDLTIEIDISVKINDGYADLIDDICTQVAAKMDFHLGGNATKCLYESFKIALIPNGEMIFAIGTMTFKATTTYTEPDQSVLDDLASIYLNWDMSNPNNTGVLSDPNGDGTVDAIDHLENLDV